MNPCRSLQRLHRSEGIRFLLFQAFHRGAVGCQQQDAGLLWDSEVRHGHPSMVPGTSRHRTVDKTELFNLPGPSRHRTESKPPGKVGPGTMAKNLVKTVMEVSDVKEEVYGALDEWAAFEVEFPLVAARKALERLRHQEQWHRIIQVTKWMFSKGIGKTHGAYGLLLKAYCMEGRLEEAGELWDKLLTSLSRSMPKNMFFFMASAYRKRDMTEKVVEVFEQMESFGIKPDKDFLRRAEEAYQQLNMPEKVEVLGRKYALDSKTRRKEKRLMARKALKASKLEHGVSQTGGDCSRECQANADESRVEQHSSVFQGKKTWASSSIEQRVTEPEGGCNTDFQTDDDEDIVKEQTKKFQRMQTSALQCKEQRVTEPGGRNTYFPTDDDEDSVKEQTKTFQGKRTQALCSKDGTSNCSKNFTRFKKTDAASPTDDDFVEQVIATMSKSSFRSVKQSKQM